MDPGQTETDLAADGQVLVDLRGMGWAHEPQTDEALPTRLASSDAPAPAPAPALSLWARLRPRAGLRRRMPFAFGARDPRARPVDGMPLRSPPPAPPPEW